MKKLLIALFVLLPVTLWAQTTAEPYVVLSQDSLTVTFYYDDQKASRGGMEINSRIITTYAGEKNPYGTAVTAIFDESFANYTTLRSTAYWFVECNNLTEIRALSNLNTANVTRTGSMFSGCSGLTSLDLSGFNTSNVTDMGSMFYGCSGLTSLDLSSFNTSKVTDMESMFGGCSGLTSLDLSSFNTANVTNMNFMFSGCSGLTSLDVRSFNTANVTDMSYMFYGCSNLTAIEGMANLNTANVTIMYGMFDGCSGLTSLDVSGFNTANVTGMGYMFSGCYSLTSLDLSGFNTANVTDMGYMFHACSGLTSLDFSGFNTANVTDMSGMFQDCSSLTNLDFSGFNTANVTDMSFMFLNCSGLTSLDLSGFNTTNVKNMGRMFENCSGLTSLDLSGFNTANVTSMRSMFYGCSGLTSLDVSGFNTANVTDMYYMFLDCSGLTSLDVSGFNTANVTDMSWMFYNCSSLTSLDVSGFNTANVTGMRSMFYGCSGLTKIFAGDDWNTALVTDGGSMFTGCTSLVGGAGTAYDANHTDHTYAHIDGGAANPGYFTSKNAPQVDATFVGTVLTVGGQTTMGEALQTVGSDAVVQTVSTIVWNSTATLTESDLEAITNPNLLIYATDSTLVSKINNVVVNGVADNVVLTTTATGNCNFYAPEAFTARRISYTRDFQQQTQVGVSRGWESIALPFDVQSVKHEKQGDIAPFGSTESGKHFWLRRLTPDGLQRATRIEANVPYVLSMPNNEEYSAEYNLGGRVTFSAQNATVPVTAAKVTALADSSITMVPTTVAVGRSSSVWALNVGQVRGSYLEGSVFERDYREVRPFEAYTVHRQGSSDDDNPSPRMIPVQKLMGSDATGIEEVRVERSEVSGDRWYDLNGRRLQARPTAKGVYIKDGRKVVIK